MGPPYYQKGQGGNIDHKYYSWLVPTLPYIERAEIYAAIMTKYATTSRYSAFKQTANNPFNAAIPAFWCPSDPSATFNSFGGGRTSYRCNRGDIRVGHYSDSVRGVYRRGNVTTFALGDILDGTSNTAMIGEGIIQLLGSEHGAGPQPKPKGMVLATTLTVSSNISLCYAVSTGSAPGNPDYYPFSPTITDNPAIGHYNHYQYHGTIYGFVSCSGFFTMIPPNGPVCGLTVNYSVRSASPAGSYHSGGANIAMADGSVRFVSETIDVGDPTQDISSYYSNPGVDDSAITYIGPSPWGVYGAMGSAQGAESKSL